MATAARRAAERLARALARVGAPSVVGAGEASLGSAPAMALAMGPAWRGAGPLIRARAAAACGPAHHHLLCLPFSTRATEGDSEDTPPRADAEDAAEPAAAREVDEEEADAASAEEEGAAAADDDEAAADEEADDEAVDVAALEASLDEAEAQRDDYREKLVRTLADMENLRGRASRQVEDARKFATQSFAKSLLDVSDNLERALSAVDPVAMTEGEGSDGEGVDHRAILASLHEGVAMTERQMMQAFEREGLVRFRPEVGDAFDPNVHEARLEVPAMAAAAAAKAEGGDGEAAAPAPGTVALVLKAGFTLHGRVIRPAEVGVVSGA